MSKRHHVVPRNHGRCTGRLNIDRESMFGMSDPVVYAKYMDELQSRLREVEARLLIAKHGLFTGKHTIVFFRGKNNAIGRLHLGE